MNLENICEGLIVKNYKELCKIMNWKATLGKGRMYQLLDLERYCEYHKEGNSYVIDKVFDEVSPKQVKRGGNNTKRKDTPNLKIAKELEDNHGVYCIINEDKIYIGSTTTTFRTRFLEHWNGCDVKMKHTYDLLHNGGCFYILQDMNEICDVKLIRMVEYEYIKQFLFLNNWNVINKKETNYLKGYQNIKHKNIKILEENYIQALQLLAKQGLIDIEEVEM